MKKEEINQDFLEKSMIKTLYYDKTFLTLFTNKVDPAYFDNSTCSIIYNRIKDHWFTYNEIPTHEIIKNSVDEKERHEVNETLKDIDSLDIDVSENYNFIFENTENWLVEQALKKAVLDTASLINEGKKDQYNISKEYFERALTKSLKTDIGLDYFNTISERLKRILSASEIKVPSFYPQFDEFLNGGFPPFTLSIVAASVHVGKSNWMANVARRQALNGYTPVILSLEMAEDAFAQRIDAGISGLDINRIYDSKKKELLTSLKEAKNNRKGDLFIKQFPTGGATVNDFKSYLHELKIRGYKPGPIFVDYLNIMKPTYDEDNGNLYTRNKRISEELRALSFEYETPVISGVQLTTEGMQMSVSELNYWHVAECRAINATVDFMAFLGIDQDAMVYNNEILYKIAKNRLGGRVGEVSKLYWDDRSLRLYDETELDQWIKDANLSKGSRDLAG